MASINRKIGENDKITRLKGKEFEPPRKPDMQTHPLVVAFNDRRYGTQKGQADAGGYGMADEQGVPHAECLIDEQAERCTADQRHGFRYPKENADKIRQDAVEQQADAIRELGAATKRDAKLKAEEEALGRRQGPSRIGYALILIVLFALTLPIDYGAAMWTPLPPLGQWMLAFLIGGVTVLCAHQAAKKVEDLQEAHGQREEDPFAYRKEQIALGFGLSIPLAVIVGTTMWRAQAFASDARATGGLVHSGAANIAFALLALMAFVVAVLAGISYRRMEPLLEIRNERAEIQAQRELWQHMLDQAERLQRQAELTLAYLDEREEHVIRAICHWAGERKARLRQRAATVAMRKRRKQAKNGRTPIPPLPAPTADQGSPTTETDTQLDLDDLLREPDDRVHANGRSV
jgi:hypothetical protein